MKNITQISKMNSNYYFEIEKKIGKNQLNQTELDELLFLSNKGDDYAAYLFGLFLLLDKNDELEALKWLKRYKKNSLHNT